METIAHINERYAILETMLFLSWPRGEEIEQSHVFKIYCRVGQTKLGRFMILRPFIKYLIKSEALMFKKYRKYLKHLAVPDVTP